MGGYAITMARESDDDDDLVLVPSLPPPAERVRLRQKVAGLTQQEVADRIGLHRVTLAHWENRPDLVPRGEAGRAYARLLARIQELEKKQEE